MIKFLLGGFFKNAFKGTLAALAAWLLTIQQFPGGPPDEIGKLVWSLGIVPLVTGAAGVLFRVAGGTASSARAR